MSEGPKWSSFINRKHCVKRRIIDSPEPDVCILSDVIYREHAVRTCKTVHMSRAHPKSELPESSSVIEGDGFSKNNATNDISLSLLDNSGNGASSDREHDTVGIESDDSDLNKENEEIDDENTSQPEDPLGFVLSSDSDGDKEGSHVVRVSMKPFGTRKFNSKVDCFMSAGEDGSRIADFLEVPSRNKLRTPLSLRLANLVRRIRSDMVVRLYTHTNDSDANDDQPQVFTTTPVFLPSVSHSSYGHVVAIAANGDILVIPASSISKSQWEHLSQVDLLKCSLVITLTPPWKELVLSDPEQQPKLIIISASSADVKEIPREMNTSAIRGISLLCDCIQKDPTGNTWHSCTYRFGCRPGRRSTTDQLCASGNDDLHILVLHKSLLWYQKRLKIAFLVKLSNGSLSMFFLPPSLCYQLPLGGDGEAGTSRRKMTASTMMNQGCVYSVKALPVTAMASDARLTRAACKLWNSLVDSLRRNEQLAHFVALNDAPNELNLFLLKRTPKFQLVLEMTAFSETTLLSPYSSHLSSSSRCLLTGVLLYEFPSGSLIAERILASNQDIQNDNDNRRLSTVFVVLVESAHCQDAVCLVFCSADAVTPLTLLISSDHLYPWVTLAYGHHWSYRVRVSIFGAIVNHDFFILDAFSRVELTEVTRLSDERLDRTRSYPLPDFVTGPEHRSASLVAIKGFHMLPFACHRDTQEVCASLLVMCTELLPSCFGEMTGLSEAQINQSSFLDPRLLIGQSVNIPLGLSIHLPEMEAPRAPLDDCQNVIIQLHPNMLT